MQIRAATPADLPAILEIYNHAVLTSTATADYEPTTLEARTQWFEEIRACGLPVLVAEEETVVGWAALVPYSTRRGYRFTAYDSIYLRPEWQGRRIGKALLEPLIEEGKRAGVHSIIASIDSANEPSIRLHASFGFEPVAYFRELVFKFDRWLDVVHMQLLV
jgi:phosphinothricin acetyltransferase